MRQKAVPNADQPRLSYVFQTSTIPNPPSFRACDRPHYSAPIALLSMASSVGNVRSLVWVSVGQSHYGISTRWNLANSPAAAIDLRLASVRGSHTKPSTID
jgi:hypothetical protein